MTIATVDQVLTLARQLPQRERVRLLSLIAQEIAADSLPPDGGSEAGTALGLLAFAGSWAGSDLPQRIAEVYATRQMVEG